MRARLLAASCLVACLAGGAAPARAADSLDACKLIRPGEASRVLDRTVSIRRGESLQSCNLRYRGANIILTAYRMTRTTFERVRSNERRAADNPDPCIDGFYRNVYRVFRVPAFELESREVPGDECGSGDEIQRTLLLYRHRRQLFLATGPTDPRYVATFAELRALARIANRRY